MVRGGGRSALFALALAVAGLAVVSGQATLGCDAGNFTQGVANISNLQTSAQLLNNTLSFLGAPSNSTVFLPTDAAWASFRAANSANAPDTNRSIAILLYNSIITYGQASAATLVAHSPVQTSAADLVAAYLDVVKGENVQPMLPISFATVNGVTVATDAGNHTAAFNGSYNFCNQQVYATNGVLLPAASYAQVPETYLSDIAELSAPVAAPAAAPVAAPTPPPATAPSTSANTPSPAPATSPAAAVSPAPAAAPAPSPSASRRAAAVAGTAGAGIIAAGLLLAMI